MDKLYLVSTHTDEAKVLKPGSELMSFTAHGEYHTSVCYFDEQMVVHMQEHGGSTAGYSGPVYGDYFILDIDVTNDLQTATRVWIQIFEFLQRRNIETINFFSGQKGYHIYIPKHFVEYPEELQQKWNVCSLVLAKWIASQIDGITDYIDWQLYTKIHAIRFPYSIHPASRNPKMSFIYNGMVMTEDQKIDLNRTLLWSPGDKDRILRELFSYEHVPDDDWLPPIDITEHYKQMRLEPERMEPARGNTIDQPNLFGEKACMLAMKTDTNIEGNPGRMNVAIRLVTWWKERGDTFDETASNLRIWNQRLPNPLSDSVGNPELDKALQAYDKGYRYTCNDSVKMRYCTSNCYFFKTRSVDSEETVLLGGNMSQAVKRLRNAPQEGCINLSLLWHGLLRCTINPLLGQVLTICAASGVGEYD